MTLIKSFSKMKMGLSQKQFGDENIAPKTYWSILEINFCSTELRPFFSLIEGKRPFLDI